MTRTGVARVAASLDDFLVAPHARRDERAITYSVAGHQQQVGMMGRRLEGAPKPAGRVGAKMQVCGGDPNHRRALSAASCGPRNRGRPSGARTGRGRRW